MISTKHASRIHYQARTVFFVDAVLPPRNTRTLTFRNTLAVNFRLSDAHDFLARHDIQPAQINYHDVKCSMPSVMHMPYDWCHILDLKLAKTCHAMTMSNDMLCSVWGNGKFKHVSMSTQRVDHHRSHSNRHELHSGD